MTGKKKKKKKKKTKTKKKKRKFVLTLSKFKVTDEPRLICVHLTDVYRESYVSLRIV